MANHNPDDQSLAELLGWLEAAQQSGRSRLARLIGHRGACLLFFGLLDTVYCISLINPSQEARHTPTLAFFASAGPLWLWATLWGIAALLCVVNAFRREDAVGFTAAIAIKVLWGLLFLAGWFAGLDRAYVSVAVWLSLAGFVAVLSTWPNPPHGASGD